MIETQLDPTTVGDHLSNREAINLSDGTRVAVRTARNWYPATRRYNRTIEGDTVTMYALIQFDNEELGWSRNGERGWYWADQGIALLDEPSTTDGENMTTAPTRHQFPTEPRVTDYWEVPTRDVQVARRWVRFTVSGHRFDVFYMGQCIGCDRSTWCVADGTILSQFGNQGLVSVTVDGEKMRCCFRCASSDSYLNVLIEKAKTITGHKGPLVWPEEILAGRKAETVSASGAAPDFEDDEDDEDD